jgi:hypothetical protein
MKAAAPQRVLRCERPVFAGGQFPLLILLGRVGVCGFHACGKLQTIACRSGL